MDQERKTRVLLIENEAYECSVFREYVDTTSDISLLGVCDGATQALQLAKDTLPDAIILDLELNEGDGLAFLCNLREADLPRRPYVVVTTNTTSKPTLQGVRDNGADFIFIKSMQDYGPKKIVDFIRRVRKYFIYHDKNGSLIDSTISKTVAEEVHEDPKSVKDSRLRTRIAAELALVGIKPNVDGKQYLIEAIMMQREQDDMDKMLTKEIYPAIAKRHKKKKETVERGIRNAITTAWNEMPMEVLEKYYTAPVSPHKGKPTNGEFISYFAEKLRGEY